MVSWDPSTYLGFAAERGRPFVDLVARVRAEAPLRVVDLGCGPGGLTRTLAERWPDAQVVGVDSSPEMIAQAAGETADKAGTAVGAAGASGSGSLTFEVGDVRDWAPAEPVDVLVTNATLQWVHGHLDLLPRWVAEHLRPGGWLALQVPANLDDPQHALLFDLCESARWSPWLAGTREVRAPILDPVGYAELLTAAGCTVDAWETTYLHVLDPEGRYGADAVLQWARGTALRPVLDALPDNGLRDEFLSEYAVQLHAAYPRRSWGTPLPFRRVFAVAHKLEVS